MAIIANTFKTYETKGIREDLADFISNISPTETPFQTNAGSGKKPKQTYFEWQIDSLASADNTNAQLEGDDIAAYDAVSPTVRVGNQVQISRKTVIIAGSQEEADKAGRKSEMAYQVAKKGKELKRDIEVIACGTNQGFVTGTATVARKTSALLSFVRTNVDVGATGANPAAPAPTYAGTRTDGTQRAFTETILKNVLQLGFTSGMNVDGATLMVGALQKQVVSGFSGIATRFRDANKGQATIVGAADVYVSDFGELSVVPNRFQRNRDGWVIDWDMVSIRDYRPYRLIELAKTGDAEKRLLLREWGLEIKNEAGLALAADLT